MYPLHISLAMVDLYALNNQEPFFQDAHAPTVHQPIPPSTMPSGSFTLHTLAAFTQTAVRPLLAESPNDQLVVWIGDLDS